MNWGEIKHFKRYEFVCKCGCGEDYMDNIFLSKLDKIRTELKQKMVLSSGYRCKYHNTKIGGSSNSKHMQGLAVDVLCSGAKAYKIMELAIKQGLTIGVSQKGDWNKRFLHLDMRKLKKVYSY